VAPQWLCGDRQLLEQENVIGCVGEQPVRVPGQLCRQADGKKFQVSVRQFAHLVDQVLIRRELKTPENEPEGRERNCSSSIGTHVSKNKTARLVEAFSSNEQRTAG
jgi:hypothetical protein